MKTKTKTQKEYHYKNIEQKMTPDGCVTRKVIVYKNGKGYKSITTHCPSKSRKNRTNTRKTIQKSLSEQEMEQITQRKFIQGLFQDCTPPSKAN